MAIQRSIWNQELAMLGSVKVYKPVLDVGHIYLSEENKTAHHSLDFILGIENHQQADPT